MSPTLNAGVPLAITLMLPGNAANAMQCSGKIGHSGCGVTTDINFASGLQYTVILRWGVRATPPNKFISPTLTIGLVMLLFIA